MAQLKWGAFRVVVLSSRWAIKLPRLTRMTRGMRSNRWERECWHEWGPAFGWHTLCPVVWADPFGLVLVMPRAEQPVSQQEALIALGDFYPGIDAETKPENFGRLGGKVVVLDYGWPDADVVSGRRDYLRQKRAARG